MLVSNNVLSALMNLDPLLSGEGVANNSTIVVDQQEERFQSILNSAGQEEEQMKMLLDHNEKYQKEGQVSAQEMLSALSFLSMVGVIATPVSYETAAASWMSEPAAPVFATLSSQEMTIQTILENANPSYVGEESESDISMTHRAASTIADSDLDSIISSLLLSKNKTSDASLADLGWNHFNEAVLTDADQGDLSLDGFTFEGEAIKDAARPTVGVAQVAETVTSSKTELLPAVEQALFSPLLKEKGTNGIAPREKLLESMTIKDSPLQVIDFTRPKDESVVPASLWRAWMGKEDSSNRQNMPDIKSITIEEYLATSLSDSKLNFDPEILGATGLLGLEPKSDSIKTNTYTPEWRPAAQVSEHEVVKQVADKLSVNRLNSKGSDRITLELEPKDLGALKIEISVHKNFVSADILTQHASVKDILDKNQAILRDALAGAGFSVDHFSVNVGDFSQHPQHFSEQEQFNNTYGTKFATLEEVANSAESDLATVGAGSKYWGNAESGISVYV